MTSTIYKPVPLPVDIELTERSRKFYDGTYKWDSEGFTGEDGVYHQFNFYDANARAPSPLPPMFLSDTEDDGLVKEAATKQHIVPGLVSSHVVVAEDYYTPVKQNEFLGAIVDITRSLGDSDVFTFASDSKDEKRSIIVRRDDLFRNHTNRDYLVGKFEGIFIACQHAGTGLELEECYRLCGVSPPNGKIEEGANREMTPPKSSKMNTKAVYRHTDDTECLSVASSPSKDADAVEAVTRRDKGRALSPVKTSSTRQSLSSNSDLSDPPSDISEWDVDLQEKQQDIATPAKIKQHKKDSSSDEVEAMQKVVTKTTAKTRGIAQKVVRKKVTRTKNTKSEMPRALLSLQTGSYMRTGVRGREDGENLAVGAASQRRSTRLARGQTKS